MTENYEKHKQNILKWRENNREKYNAYHRERNRKKREEKERQFVLDYLQNKLGGSVPPTTRACASERGCSPPTTGRSTEDKKIEY